MKKKISVDREFRDWDLPDGAYDLFKWVGAQIESMPQESRANARIYLAGEDAKLCIAFERWETPEEEREREDAEKLKELRAKNAEYEQYLALKAKYEKGVL